MLMFPSVLMQSRVKPRNSSRVIVEVTILPTGYICSLDKSMRLSLPFFCLSLVTHIRKYHPLNRFAPLPTRMLLFCTVRKRCVHGWYRISTVISFRSLQHCSKLKMTDTPFPTTEACTKRQKSSPLYHHAQHLKALN